MADGCRLCPKDPSLEKCNGSCVFTYFFSSTNVEDLDTVVEHIDPHFQSALQSCSRVDGYKVIADKLKEALENVAQPHPAEFWSSLSNKEAYETYCSHMKIDFPFSIPAEQCCLRCGTLGYVCYLPCIVSHYFSDVNELDLVLLSRIVEYEDMEEKLKTSTGVETYNWIYEQPAKTSHFTVEVNKCAAEADVRRWSKKHLVELMPPIVKFLNLAIGLRDEPGMNICTPNIRDPDRLYFVLGKGISYCFYFTFLADKFQEPRIRYTNTVWYAGVKVDSEERVLIVPAGFHTIQMPSTSFSSVGFYSALTQFVDVDNQMMYLSMDYTFEVLHVQD